MKWSSCYILIGICLALVVQQSWMSIVFTLTWIALAFWKPKEALLGLLLYFPARPFIQTLQPDLKIMADFVLLAILVRVAWDYRGRLNELARLSWYEYGFFIFLAIGAWTAHQRPNVDPDAILFQLRAFLLPYAIYFIGRRLSIQREDVVRFLWITLGMTTLVAVHGLLEKLSMRELFLPESWSNRVIRANNATRIYGMLDNPNTLALYLSFGLGAGLALWHFVKSKLKWAVVVPLLVIAGAWMLTYSRGTWIGVLLALVIYVVKERAWRVLPQFALLLALAWGMVAWPVHHWAGVLKPSVKVTETAKVAQPKPKVSVTPTPVNVEINRIKTTFGSGTMERSRVGGRLYVIDKGFEIARDYPWMGTGFATFGDSATKSYPSMIYYHYGIRKPIYTDNQYIQVIVETGALGAMGFAVYLIGFLAEAIRARRLAVLGGLGLGLVAATYWFGFIYNIWEDKVFSLYFYLILAYIAQQVAARKQAV